MTMKRLFTGAATSAALLLVLALSPWGASAQQTIRNITLLGGWATPADNFSNPTNAVTAWSLNACWDGSTWDRCPTSDGGSGAASANTSRTIEASDSLLVTYLNTLQSIVTSARAAVNLISGQAGITGGAGTVGASTPRVTLASDDPGVASLGILDDWDETDRAKVNPIVGQAGVAAGAGAVGTTTQRMTLASDDPAVTALQILDDWDESDRSKVNPIVGQAGVAGGSGTISALTQRVVVATDDEVNDALNNLATYLQPSSGTHKVIRSDSSDNDDETEIKATAGVLLWMSGRNTSTTADAFVRCTNATVASTTPGSTTVIFEMIIPKNGLGFVHASFGPAGMTFGTALTCYLATGEAVTDATDPAADKVVVNVGYR